jgi:hypothetical protein
MDYGHIMYGAIRAMGDWSKVFEYGVLAEE